MLAPICLFVYNRPEHTEKTLEALSNNLLANESILYIFSDGPKIDATIEDRAKIEKVRNIIRQKKWCKTEIIEESAKNNGLAESIINGVTKVIKTHGKIIVLEDDLITSKRFLNYMNDALVKYENANEVKQISGFSFPVPGIEQNNSSYFLPLTSTWGWATWSRVWDEIDFNCKDYNPQTLNKYQFNFYNSYNYSKLLKMQLNGRNVSSWGIRFYFNVFNRNGIILFPDTTLVKNIGWDNSGRHGASFQLYSSTSWINDYAVSRFPHASLNKAYMQLNIKYLRIENSAIIKIIKKIIQVFSF
jgi:hypothetical protein